ncbi:MAG: HIT family protein, partial [Alloprevotella sp.]|nr:HIT family protein [Alloprevotella sp.]
DDETARYFCFAKRVAKAIKEAFPCKKVGMSVFGLEVPHAHIHLMPMQTEGDMDFRREKLTLPEDEMRAIADKIYTAFTSAK